VSDPAEQRKLAERLMGRPFVTVAEWIDFGGKVLKDAFDVYVWYAKQGAKIAGTAQALDTIARIEKLERAAGWIGVAADAYGAIAIWPGRAWSRATSTSTGRARRRSRTSWPRRSSSSSTTRCAPTTRASTARWPCSNRLRYRAMKRPYLARMDELAKLAEIASADPATGALAVYGSMEEIADVLEVE
jgi:hypothetical protein